ncbi:MAG: tyrosine-type recombinase/integrase [Bdellovibrionota bacterium]
MSSDFDPTDSAMPALPPDPRSEGQNREGHHLTPAASRLGEERLITVLESYLQYYAAGDSHTARAKRYDLQHFLEFLAGSPNRVSEVLVSAWTLQTTKDFVEHRLSLGEAPATVSRRLATIKHFGRTLAERVHGYINPAREAKAPVIQPTRPHGLTEPEIKLLRDAAQQCFIDARFSFLALRNKFLLELLLATGLRADEVRLLVLAQLSDDFSWLRNVKTKGKKFRNVYLDTAIRPLFEEYLNGREQMLTERYPEYRELSDAQRQRFPVFVSLYRADIANPQSFGLAPKTIWRIIASFGSRAQALAQTPIGNLHPHKLRHTFAHGLLDSSKDVRLVAQALGHSDVRTTMRYTERTDETLAKAIEQKVRTS